jgi:hypothetical protein
VIVNEISGQFGHSRDICGRANVGGIVSSKDGRTLRQPTFGSFEASRQILAILQLPNAGARELSPAAFDETEKVMVWLEQLEVMSSAKQMDKTAHFSVHGTSNSKIMASLLQGRPRPVEDTP